jgi:hypothetical protein
MTVYTKLFTPSEVKSSVNPPPGWQVVNSPVGNTLDRVGFYSGPPVERASLVPDKTQNKKGESRDIWTFSRSSTEQIWAACFYTGTMVSIAQQMDQGIKRCEVRYQTTRMGERVSVIEAHCE